MLSSARRIVRAPLRTNMNKETRGVLDVSTLGSTLISFRYDRVLDRPPELQRRVVPDQGDLAAAVVFRGLLVVEDRPLAHHQLAVAELRWHKDLQPIGVR